MNRTSVELAISAPVALAFAYAADRRTRITLLPDNFTPVRLLSDETAAVGARFSFTVHTDRGAYESVTEMTEYHPDTGFTERTTSPDITYETTWQFTAGEDGITIARTEMRYPAPSGFANRLLDRLVGQRALRHSLLVELVRLKQQLEG